jgi:hypothetical protein
MTSHVYSTADPLTKKYEPVSKAIMSSSRPRVVQPPPPPVIEDTEAAQQEYADMLRRRRGRASAILSDTPRGQQAPQTASKVLLGA